MKSNLTESVLKYLSITDKECLNESKEQTYKSSTYGVITVQPRIGETVSIGKVDFKGVERVLSHYIKPSKKGVFKSVSITVGYDTFRKKDGVVYLRIELQNASYKDISSMSGVGELEVKGSGYPERDFILKVASNPYIANPDNKPNMFQFSSTDRSTELKYRARYDVGKLNNTQKLIKNNIFVSVRNAAYKLNDVLFD